MKKRDKYVIVAIIMVVVMLLMYGYCLEIRQWKSEGTVIKTKYYTNGEEEHFLVTVKTKENMTKTFDNQELYDLVYPGEKVEVIVLEKYFFFICLEKDFQYLKTSLDS